MKKRNYFLLTAVAFVAVLNLFLSINGQSLSSGLKLLTVEAIANTEVNKDGKGTLKSLGCGVLTEYIVGHDPDGNPITEKHYESGEMGGCEPYGNNSCTPYECIRKL